MNNFFIKFIFNKKDYYINDAIFQSGEKQHYQGNLGVTSYKLIEGGGMLVNPKDFPTEFIKGDFTFLW